MGDIVSFSKARKAKARAEKETVAEANRLKFGRSKAERKLTDARDDLANRQLDGARRTSTEDDDGA